MRPETHAALVSVASAWVGTYNGATLASTFGALSDWQELATQAELHGLSVMLGRLSANGDIALPRELDLQLKALTIRHQKVLAARRVVLLEVIELFEQHAIEFVFLKGAALANLIYDPPWLRPMRDIDLLVKREQAAQAQTLLREIGFRNEDYAPGFLFEHHHLPNSTRIQDNFTISLEIHHDALSGDVDASITLDTLEGELLAFDFAGNKAYAFGHEDMLKHLCFHTFEPAEIIKLGSMVDMVRYANHYVDVIDWRALQCSQPYTANALRCIHALIPLPEVLRKKIIGPGSDQWQPRQMGIGFTPLSKISRLAGVKEKFHALFVPSPWWMHIFYVVPPGKSLFYTRFFHHPVTVCKWVLRRYRASIKSKALPEQC